MSNHTSQQPTCAAAATVTALRPHSRRPEPGAGRVYDSIVDLAPNPDNPTPMVRLSERMNPHADYDVLVKLEGMNPFGSIKDRTALYMLNGLQLGPGQALTARRGLGLKGLDEVAIRQALAGAAASAAA